MHHSLVPIRDPPLRAQHIRIDILDIPGSILNRDDRPTSPIVRRRRAKLSFHVPNLYGGNIPPTTPRVSPAIPNSRGT